MGYLPQAAYYSQEWFDKEMATLFSNTWQFAGLVEDVKDAGDFITVKAGLNNLIVLKTESGNLKSFHNMCRHRGTPILETAGKSKKMITCPYHDWVYNTEGDLISVPEKSTEFTHLSHPLKDCGLNLKPAQVGVFKGMIFVHPDFEAPSLAEYFKGLEGYLGPHRVEELIEYRPNNGEKVYSEVVQANWKLVAENYMDHYHLAHLHKDTLNMYNHKQAKFGWVGDHYWFYEPLASTYAKKLHELSPYPIIPSIPENQMGAYVPWFFPNIGISESESTWSTFHLEPIAPNQTRISIRTKVADVAGGQWISQYLKSSLNDFWRTEKKGSHHAEPLNSGDFMQEDVFVCEQLQKSLMSPYFEVGAWAKRGEQAILEFQKRVLKAMEPK